MSSTEDWGATASEASCALMVVFNMRRCQPHLNALLKLCDVSDVIRFSADRVDLEEQEGDGNEENGATSASGFNVMVSFDALPTELAVASVRFAAVSRPPTEGLPFPVTSGAIVPLAGGATFAEIEASRGQTCFLKLSMASSSSVEYVLPSKSLSAVLRLVACGGPFRQGWGAGNDTDVVFAVNDAGDMMDLGTDNGVCAGKVPTLDALTWTIDVESVYAKLSETMYAWIELVPSLARDVIEFMLQALDQEDAVEYTFRLAATGDPACPRKLIAEAAPLAFTDDEESPMSLHMPLPKGCRWGGEQSEKISYLADRGSQRALRLLKARCRAIVETNINGKRPREGESSDTAIAIDEVDDTQDDEATLETAPSLVVAGSGIILCDGAAYTELLRI